MVKLMIQLTSQTYRYLVIYPVILRVIQVKINQTIQSTTNKYKDSQDDTKFDSIKLQLSMKN